MECASKSSTLMSLSGMAAFGRHAGCKASGENMRKCQGKGRRSAKLARTEQLGSGFSPGIFAYFHYARKLAISHLQRTTRSFLGYPHHVTSRDAGAGASGPCRRVRERGALESFLLTDKFQFAGSLFSSVINSCC